MIRLSVSRLASIGARAVMRIASAPPSSARAGIGIGIGLISHGMREPSLAAPAETPATGGRLDEVIASLDADEVARLIASSPGRRREDEEDDDERVELQVAEAEIRVGARASTELLGWGRILELGQPGTLTADKVLFEFSSKWHGGKRRRGGATVPKQRWIPAAALTSVAKSSPRLVSPAAGTASGDPPPTPPRSGPLFSEGAGPSGSHRATRPSAGEASSSDGMPKLAAMERGRAMKQNRPVKIGKPKRGIKPMTKAGGALPARGAGRVTCTKESNVPIAKRLAEFPDSGLIEAPPGKLFCAACKTPLKNILGTLKTHCGSESHKEKLVRYVEVTKDDTFIKQFMREYFTEHPDEKCASLSDEQHLHRFRIVASMLKAGVAINKVDELRPVLERDGHAITAASHLAGYIPKIETLEHDKLGGELEGQYVEVIYDGSPRHGEAIVVILRWVQASEDGWSVQMRLVAFRTLVEHPTGAQLAQFIFAVLLTTLKLKPWQMIASARDSASVNGACERALVGLLPALQDILCISHTVAKCGEHVELPTLEQFMTSWLQIVQHHQAAKTTWKGMIGKAMVGFSTIRWCSRDECANELARNFGQLGAFLQALIDKEIGDALPKKMIQIYNSKRAVLEAELACSLDLERLITLVYRMEGDGLLVLLARSEIEAVFAWGETVGDDQSSLPNVAAVLRKNTTLKVGVKTYEYYGEPYNSHYVGKVNRIDRGGKVLVTYPGFGADNDVLLEPHEAVQAVDVRELAEWQRLSAAAKAGIEYLRKRLTGECDRIYDCSQMYEMLRLVQVFDPSFAAQFATPAWVDALSSIPPLEPLMEKLKEELPEYLVKCQGVSYDHGDVAAFTDAVLLFWANNGSKFPTWARAMQIVGTFTPFTPSSAAAERVFSMLKLMFGHLQASSLADMIQAALMLRYNKRRVA